MGKIIKEIIYSPANISRMISAGIRVVVPIENSVAEVIWRFGDLEIWGI
jgi:hypothetical protein